MVRKSWKRNLTVIVRPRTFAARSRLATESHKRTSSRSSASCVWRSDEKVSSWPTDFSGRSGSTGRSSRPFASWWRWRPFAWPSTPTSDASGSAARSPTVETPSRRSRSRVAGPTPQSACTGWPCKNSSSSSEGTTTTPGPGLMPAGLTFGFAASDASFATSFVLDADRAGEAEPFAHLGPDLGRDLASGAEPAARSGDVEEGLVQCDRLDERRHRVEDLVHLRARVGVELVVAAEEEARAGTGTSRALTASRRTRRAPWLRMTQPRRHRAPPAPPTMTGRPASDGLRRTSHATKNASMSTWRMVRSVNGA